MSRTKKIMILGARGMLGYDMVKTLSIDYEIIPLDIEELDITKKDDVMKAMIETRPDIVINCAAYTDVDGCESNIEKAFSVNAEGVRYIAQSCKNVDAKLIHYSTDYIFNGKKKSPYKEEDLPNPLNIYGKSKLKGERYVQEILNDYLIIRTEWLFGKNGKNFVSTILELSDQKDELRVVNDQIGSPTYTVDLAYATKTLIEKAVAGIFNITNSGHCSWFEFAKKILDLSNTNHIKIFSISSQQLQRPARRPRNSILNCNKFQIFTGMNLSNWESALQDFLDYE